MGKQTGGTAKASLPNSKYDIIDRICKEVENTTQKYDTLSESQKIAFGSAYRVPQETMTEIQSLDFETKKNIISRLVTSAVHIKTAFILDSMDRKLSDVGMSRNQLAHQAAFDSVLFTRAKQSGTFVIPTSTMAFFCDFAANQSIAEAFLGFPSEIILPLNLGLVAYRLKIARDDKFERATITFEKYNKSATLSGLTIDTRTIFERIVEHSTDRGYGKNRMDESCISNASFFRLKTRIVDCATSDMGDTSNLSKIDQRKQRIPLTLSAAAIIASQLNVSPDYFLARDYTLHNRIYIPGRFITNDMADDVSARAEVTDERIRRMIGMLLCMPREKRMLACGEIIAATI